MISGEPIADHFDFLSLFVVYSLYAWFLCCLVLDVRGISNFKCTLIPSLSLKKVISSELVIDLNMFPKYSIFFDT